MDISEIKSYFTKGMAIMLFITTIVISSYLNVSAETKEEERRRLEAELSQIEGQIKEYETTVNNYQVQGRGLQTEIDRLNANIKKLNNMTVAICVCLKTTDKTTGPDINA